MLQSGAPLLVVVQASFNAITAERCNSWNFSFRISSMEINNLFLFLFNKTLYAMTTQYPSMLTLTMRSCGPFHLGRTRIALALSYDRHSRIDIKQKPISTMLTLQNYVQRNGQKLPT